MKHPIALIILDGFGHSPEKKYNAIAQAKKPTFDFFMQTYPHCLLLASGKAVGLPDGYMGNSEVGHITLGAGRIVPSVFLQIHEDIENGKFQKNSVLIQNLAKLAETNNALHIMGLLSDAGVNSHTEIIEPLLQAAQRAGIKKIYLHAFLDGRDTLPQQAPEFLANLDQLIKGFNVSLGSITGRYYAMDRDNHWDRTQLTYDMLTKKENTLTRSGRWSAEHEWRPLHSPLLGSIEVNGNQFTDWAKAIEYYYSQKITDEFIPPTRLNPDAIIENNDGIIFFNFREDRARQLTACFAAPETVPFAAKINPLFCITPIQFAKNFHNQVLYTQKPISNTLKEILSNEGKSIFSIAETEKYAHVTYFFGGGHEKPFPHEKQLMIPSIPTKNYIDHPCMKAPEITQAVISSLEKKPSDFYLINYANADMVGHSGSLPATIKAVECIDEQLKKLYGIIVQKMNGTIYITADHGNAEKKYNEKSQQPWTAHTTNPVPFIMIRNGLENSQELLPLKGIADVAPFIIKNID